jgi:hypothetical protein
MHQRIIKDVLAKLDDERSRYFSNIFNNLTYDDRAQLNPNLLYAVIKEVAALVPPYLPPKDFINRLFRFIDDNSKPITTLMFSAAYVTDSTVLRSVTDEFVEEVAEATYKMHQDGTLETGEKKVRSYSWPYENANFPFAD